MIKIDVDTRCWQIPKEEYFLGVESDDKVKILKFELSKNEFYDGLNFTDCNCFINYNNGDNDTIPYVITDMEVQEDGTVTFTWEVSRGATIFKGNTFAVLCAKKVRDDGTVTNEWNSRIGSFTVAKGLEPSSSIVEVPEIDIISQLLLVAQNNIDQSNSLLEKAEGLGYLKEEYDVLEARMNQFTSLQEGSTTGDAELIDGRIGYDGTVYDNIGGAIRKQVGELKGDIDEVIATGFEVVSSYNRVNPNTINIGKYVGKETGNLSSNPNYNATDFIPIKKDHIYAFNGNYNHWAVYDTNKQFISLPTLSTSNGYNIFTAYADGYIRCSYSVSNNQCVFVEINEYAEVKKFLFSNQPKFYDNKIIEKETKEDFSVYLYNLMDASKIKVGYYGDTVNVNYDTTDWIKLPSEPLKIYDKSLKIVLARNVWYAERDFNRIYYTENVTEILAETPTFAKAKYFKYSVPTGQLKNTMVFPSSIVPFKFFEYGDKCLRKEYISPYLSASDAKVEALKGTNGLKISADMLTSNTSLKLNDFPSHLKKGIAITADMKFSAFSKVSIGKGYESYRGDWLEIDDTNVIYKHYEQSTSTVSTVAHGLTIKDSLSIALYIDNDGVCNVSLSTNGGSAEFSIQWGYEQNGKPFIVGDQEMTEVNLSAIALDAKCPIWLFGDSYFGVAENRVIGQLKNLGYTDGVLVDGMAGIGTSSMLDDLQKLIALGGSPKIVICCEGMNDGGSGYASNINAIIGACDGVGAELVLYKVPVVANRITENKAVNTAMLATGKRYIDAYKAVGATDEGTWWDGYLNSDGVHPNEIGAKAIAQRILIDVPEIMQYGRKVGNVSGDISGDK